jgi:hypothetical protein
LRGKRGDKERVKEVNMVELCTHVMKMKKGNFSKNVGREE